MYHGKKKDIDVHPEYAMPEEKILVVLGGKPIEFELRKGEAKSKCVKCNALNPTGSHGDIKGFRYESLSADPTLTLHVSCFNDARYQNMDSEKSRFTEWRKLFSNLMFKWCPNGPPAACDMCCMMVEGPRYRCKNFSVHPDCAMLKEMILLVVDEEATVLNLRQGEANSKCVYCSELKPKGSQGNITGFCYESTCMKRTLHVSCFIKYSSAAQKPNNKHRTIKQGDGVLGKLADAVFDEVPATLLSALIGDFSPIVALVLKLGTDAFPSTSSKKN